MSQQIVHLLIVDDEESIRIPLADHLQTIYHYHVDTARDGQGALQFLDKYQGQYDVALIDQVLEGDINGIDLLRQIKSTYPEIQVIMFTGWGMKDGIEALRQGAYRYFAKPFNLEELAMTISFAAEKKIMTSQNFTIDVFVVMAFAEKYKVFYQDVIKKNIEMMGLVCKRADDFFLSSVIMDDIVGFIRDAKFIVADFSGRSPNVFFETGIAHALYKNVILLTQDLEDVPPRLRIIRCHRYKDDLDGAKEFPDILKKAISGTKEKNYPPLFKMESFEKKSGLCMVLTPLNENGERAYKQLISNVGEKLGLECVRAKEIFDSTSVLDKIWTRINESNIVIADLTDRDPDVFYLAGLAFGLKKKIIYLAQREEDIPFDLKKGSSIIYSLSSYESGKNARNVLFQIMSDQLK